MCQQGVDLLSEPFLDRGVRRLAGQRLLVTSVTSLLLALQQQQQGGGGVIWVWNTGVREGGRGVGPHE